MEDLKGRRLVVFGCGYIGGAVARAARQRGATVVALTRNAATAAELAGEGIATVVADLADEAWHGRIAGRPDLVLNSVSSGGGGLEAYRHSYVEGMASIARWAAQAGPVGTAVYTSSTSVYPQGDGARVDEGAPVGGGERADLLLEAERTLRAAIGAWQRWFILRLAGIYGPGRHYLADQVRTGSVAGLGSHRLNLVHRDDAVSAILGCLLSPEGCEGGIFNVADGEAAPKSEVAAWIAEVLGAPPPRFSGEPVSPRRALTPDRIILSQALRREIGWSPRFPTYREGFGSFLSR